MRALVGLLLLLSCVSFIPDKSSAGTLGTVEESKFTKDEELFLEMMVRLGADEGVKESYREFASARMEYAIKAMEERDRVIYWSNRASILIFLIAHAVLLLGLWAAIGEFLEARKIRHANVEASEIKIGLDGLALKTSLHGTVILLFSMALYYMFLVYVLPISSI